MSVKVKVNKITPSLKKKKKELDTIHVKAYKFWKKVTPIRSGNARRRTSLTGKVIHAKYPYAERLDNGWSKQAPQGMFIPLVKYLKTITNKVMRKK